jgi:hypothetical protein
MMTRQLGSIFFKKWEFKDVESHPTRVEADGKIYARLSPRKEKRPKTDMIML